VPDGVKTSGEEATESAREGGSGVEDSDAEGEFGSAVEVGEVKNL
jgi:hypothetical protein